MASSPRSPTQSHATADFRHSRVCNEGHAMKKDCSLSRSRFFCPAAAAPARQRSLFAFLRGLGELQMPLHRLAGFGRVSCADSAIDLPVLLGGILQIARE